MPDLPLGRIQRVNARDAWAHEAHDFTPWLADDDNFAALAETLHFFDAEVEATEEAVGDFSADITARDRDGLILIENQLAQTDHTHLGQILTYLAGFDEPARIVWISTKVREEHRAAVDWLNAHTPSDFSFFAVELELFQIGDGPLAPHYHVVAQPNEWSRHRSVQSRQRSEELRGAASVYRALWGEYQRYLADHDASLARRTPAKTSWWSFSVGRTGFNLATIATVQESWIGVELYCGCDPEKVGFDTLYTRKEEIEAALGEAVTWERLDNKRGWRIIIRRQDANPAKREEWPSYFAWYTPRLIAFRDVLSPEIRKLDLTLVDGEGE